MNNGVENNQIEEPILVPIDPAAVPTGESATVPTDITTNGVATTEVPMPVNVVPQPVVQQPAIVPQPVVEQQPAVPIDNSIVVPQNIDVNSVMPETVMPPTEPIPVEPQPVEPTTMEVPETIPTIIITNPPTEPQPEEETKQEEPPKEEQKPRKKKKSPLGGFIFIILVALGGFAYYTKTTSERTITELKYKCIPAAESKEEVSLDINSTLVQELYQKVATTIREDAAQPEWNDTMKLYLAFRQIPDYKIYDSNCNLFSAGKMEPYTCEVTTTFTPRAFKKSTLELEWKKLYGETTKMPLINVKLQNSCVGGFEYIAEREEYVQGYCKESHTPTYKVKKELTGAATSNNRIILTEKVEYYGTDKIQVPAYLRSGTYYYTFRLDTNYNFVLISKDYDQKYE